MMIPTQIYDICNQIRERMKAQRIYSELIDYQIFNVAIQLHLYSDLIKRLIRGGKNKPATRELTTSGESLRRSLRELGLTNSGKEFDIQMNDPLTDLVNSMQQEDEQPTLTKKKKKE